MSLTGAITTTGSQNVSVECRVGPGGATGASMDNAHLTAVKVATLN
jgi:molybdenum cofactor biosynthesis enzyme